MKKSLILMIASAGVVCADSTWTGSGADAKWSTAANWAENQVPSGGVLHFAGSVKLTNVNDLADLSIDGIRFASGAGKFSLEGNAVTVGSVISNQSSVVQTVQLPVVLNNSIAAYSPSTSARLTLSGPLSGAGQLVVGGVGEVGVFGANPQFSGGIKVIEGRVSITNGVSCGTGDLWVDNVENRVTAGQLAFYPSSSGLTVTNRIFLRRIATDNSIYVGAVGDVYLRGPVVYYSQPRVSAVSGGRLHFLGGVSRADGTVGNGLVFNADLTSGYVRIAETPLNLGTATFYNDSGRVVLDVAGSIFGTLFVTKTIFETWAPFVLNGNPLNFGTNYGGWGILDLKGNNQLIGTVSSSLNQQPLGKRLAFTSDVPAVLTIRQTAAQDYVGEFDGALSLVKTGGSDFNLKGTNRSTMAGPITVGEGKLGVYSVANLGTAPVALRGDYLTVSNGASFAVVDRGSQPESVVPVKTVLSPMAGVSLPSGTAIMNVASGRVFEVAGPVSGSGKLKKMGLGTLLLARAPGGTVEAAEGSLLMAAKPTGAVILNGGGFGVSFAEGIFTATDLSQMLGSLQILAPSLFVLDASHMPNQELTLDTVFTDNGSTLGLEKVNAGRVTLTGASSYTGNTRLSDGTLSVPVFPVTNESSPLGAATDAQKAIVFAGGTLEYTGAGTVATRRLFTLSGTNTADFSIADPAGVLKLECYNSCDRNTGVYASDGVLVKRGPGTLVVKRINATTPNFPLSAIYLLGGTLATEGTKGNGLTETGMQQNLGRLAAQGPALILGDGATITYDTPIENYLVGGTQIVQYVGTQVGAVHNSVGSGLTLTGPADPSENVCVFDINDGADEVDLLLASVIGIYTVNQSPTTNLIARTAFVKDGAGTLKITANNRHRGVTVVRKGRILVNADIPQTGISRLGDVTNQYGVVFDGGSADRPVVAYDGTASVFSYRRGTHVKPNAYGQIGSVSNIAVTINAEFKNEGVLGFCSYTMNDTFAVDCTVGGTGGLAKTGPGIVNLNVANTYEGKTIVEAGTLKVNADGAIPNGRNLVLNGGYLDMNGHTVSFGTLSVGGTASIDASQGLVFANSSGMSWTGRLTFMNRTTKKVYFGTAASGLTAQQLALITVPAGYREVKMGQNGELIFVPKGTLMILR